jgi:hypothetical protein
VLVTYNIVNASYVLDANRCRFCMVAKAISVKTLQGLKMLDVSLRSSVNTMGQ